MRRVQHIAASAVIVTLLTCGGALAQDLTFNNYRDAMSAGAGLYRSGNLAASRQPFEAAVDLARNDRETKNAYTPLVKVYAEVGEFDKMFSTAEEVIKLTTHKASETMAIRSLMGNCQRKSQLDACKKRYEDRLAKQPKDRLAIKMLGGYHHNITRDYGKEAEYLLKLVDLDKDARQPPDIDLMFNLAMAYSLSRDNQQAAGLFERTALLSKDIETSCYKEAAVAWQRDGQMDKALAAAQQAHDIGPDVRAKFGVYHWHRALGEVFLAGKKKEQAVKQMEAALESAPIDAYKKQCADLLTQANAL